MDELLGVLEGRDHWARVEALEKLAAFSEAVPHLVELLDDEKECRHTRGAAIASIVKIHPAESPALVRALKRTLLYDEDSEVRAAAANAMGELGLVSATGALRHVAKSGDPELAPLAAAALAKLGQF